MLKKIGKSLEYVQYGLRNCFMVVLSQAFYKRIQKYIIIIISLEYKTKFNKSLFVIITELKLKNTRPFSCIRTKRRTYYILYIAKLYVLIISDNCEGIINVEKCARGKEKSIFYFRNVRFDLMYAFNIRIGTCACVFV